MVKRGSEEIIQAVYISGVKVMDQGKVNKRLGQQQLGKVLASNNVA